MSEAWASARPASTRGTGLGQPASAPGADEGMPRRDLHRAGARADPALGQTRDRRRFLAGALCATAAVVVHGRRALAHSDAPFEGLLGRYVVLAADGVARVDYRRWKANAADRASLAQYIAELSASLPSRMAPAAAFAFWCNLYNALTLAVVLDHYPVASIRDIKSDGVFDPLAYFGPWRTTRVAIESRPYSLDAIENDVLRRQFGDARVHYAINCASHGCPNLRRKPWSAASLDAELNAAAADYINHPRGVSVLAHNRLQVSSLYRWYAADFGADDAALLAHFGRYAGPRLAAALAARPTIASHAYDWSLNDAAALSR